MPNMTHNSFYVFIFIFNSLHVSSTSCSSSGETNCVNTTSGNCHSVSMAVSCAGRKWTPATDTEWQLQEVVLTQFVSPDVAKIEVHFLIAGRNKSHSYRLLLVSIDYYRLLFISITVDSHYGKGSKQSSHKSTQVCMQCACYACMILEKLGLSGRIVVTYPV